MKSRDSLGETIGAIAIALFFGVLCALWFLDFTQALLESPLQSPPSHGSMRDASLR